MKYLLILAGFAVGGALAGVAIGFGVPVLLNRRARLTVVGGAR